MPRHRTALMVKKSDGQIQYKSVIPKALSPGEELFAMHLKAHDFNPEREYKFYEGRKWRFDFAFPSAMVAIEIEGGTCGQVDAIIADRVTPKTLRSTTPQQAWVGACFDLLPRWYRAEKPSATCSPASTSSWRIYERRNPANRSLSWRD